MILYYISQLPKKIEKEHFVTFDEYSFDKYYGNYRKDYGYNTNNYKYPVFFDKNYKNFADNNINYNTVYDAEYKNIL
jgi:hypothetical protein